MSTVRPTDLAFLNEQQRSLVEENLSLVNRIGSRWRARCRTHVEYADLLQVGALGLIDAARRYDPARNDAFAAFAKDRIRGAICDALRAIDPLTRRRRQSVRSVEYAIRELGAKLGREPETEEIAKHMKWQVADVSDAQGDLAALSVGWAQTLEVPEDGTEGAITMQTTEVDDPCAILLRTELKAELAHAITVLPERHQMVLSLYYHEGLTMKKIGDVLEVTESRVSQIHSSAVATLRQTLREATVVGAGA